MDGLKSPSTSKVLIIRFSSIGDIVLTSPVVRSLKRQRPDLSLHFLVKKGYESLVACNPHIDKVHIFNGDTRETLRELRAEKFHFVVDLQCGRRSRRISHALRVPRATFPKLNFRKWILVNFKTNLLPGRHVVDRYFEAVKPLGAWNDGQGLDFFIPEGEAWNRKDLPPLFEKGFVAVSLAAAHATKRIPETKIIEIARLLCKPVLLLGGKDAVEAGERIALALGDRAFNGCGKFSLFQSADIIRQSEGLLTGDTGLMHIAAALRKPIASVWGNTVPELGMYPYLPGHRDLFRIFEICPLGCRPCSKLGYKRCPLKHFQCMNNLPAKPVAAWINRFSNPPRP